MISAHPVAVYVNPTGQLCKKLSYEKIEINYNDERNKYLSKVKIEILINSLKEDNKEISFSFNKFFMDEEKGW